MNETRKILIHLLSASFSKAILKGKPKDSRQAEPPPCLTWVLTPSRPIPPLSAQGRSLAEGRAALCAALTLLVEHHAPFLGVSDLLFSSCQHSGLDPFTKKKNKNKKTNSPGKNAGVSSHSLLQGIFPTQGSSPGLLHCRRILYHLSHRGSQLAYELRIKQKKHGV